MDPDQTAPIGAVCSGSTLFASILNSSVILGKYLQQTTSADDIFRCIFFLGAFRVNTLTSHSRNTDDDGKTKNCTTQPSNKTETKRKLLHNGSSSNQ